MSFRSFFYPEYIVTICILADFIFNSNCQTKRKILSIVHTFTEKRGLFLHQPCYVVRDDHQSINYRQYD